MPYDYDAAEKEDKGIEEELRGSLGGWGSDVSDQYEAVAAYKRMTALSEDEIRTKQAEKKEEKRRINEKQIRALRGKYRSGGGLLNYQSPASGQLTQMTNEDLSTKLGA